MELQESFNSPLLSFFLFVSPICGLSPTPRAHYNDGGIDSASSHTVAEMIGFGTQAPAGQGF